MTTLPTLRYPVFAMDTSFYHSLGVYEFDARCEMLAELGYDATYLTLWSDTAWQDVPRLATVKAQYGLEVAGVYVTLDLDAPAGQGDNDRILRLVETLEGCHQIEITLRSSDPNLKPSDPAGVSKAVAWLEKLLKAAESRYISLALYPHRAFWMERIEDAVGLCGCLQHPLLGVVFCGYHWYAVDGRHLATRLDEAAPFLRSVNLCGSRRPPGNVAATIEPLDEGELDNFTILGELRRVGYAGMVGIQGYSVGGDVYAKLKRSLTALRDMERRLDEHPAWARLRPRQ